jgi:hypothetical protein
MALAEQSTEMGTDYGRKFALRKSIDKTPLASDLLEVTRPMKSVGLNMAMFTAVVGDARPMLAKLTLHGLGLTIFLIGFALTIYAYTLENPSLYRIVNGQVFDPELSEGPGGVSAGLRTCLPYIKHLEESHKALPEEFRFAGRCYRGVNWTFPSPQNHDPESYFLQGRKLFWYEFKSKSREVSTMYQERFCGKTGTIFTIDAKCGYKIELFSDFGGAEAEVPFPPLTKLQVTTPMKQCDSQCLMHKEAGLPDQICLKQVIPADASPPFTMHPTPHHAPCTIHTIHHTRIHHTLIPHTLTHHTRTHTPCTHTPYTPYTPYTIHSYPIHSYPIYSRATAAMTAPRPAALWLARAPSSLPAPAARRVAAFKASSLAPAPSPRSRHTAAPSARV